MNDGDIKAVLDRLVGSLDDEVGDWDEVLERAARPIRDVERRRLRSRLRLWHPRRGLLFVGAAAVLTALVALTVAAPWRGGPSILDRAAAAILAPAPGQVLYERIEIHPGGFTSGRPSLSHVTFRVRVWIDGASPYRFRAIFDSTLPGDTPVELGGMLGNFNGLSYSASDDVLDPVGFQIPVTQSALDPAAFVRSALTSGRAKVEGRTTIRGKEVLRIRVSARVYGPLIPIARFYVDAHTYRPVRIVLNTTLPPQFRADLPLVCLSYLVPFGCLASSKPVIVRAYDFAEYRYLPATAANRRLTNIRAAHPHVKIV